MNIDIRLSIGFATHPKTVKMTRRIGAEGVLALLRLWGWAAQNRPDGILRGMDWEDIEIAAGWCGEDGKLFKELVELHFIDRVDDGDTYSIHDWEAHQPYASKSDERAKYSARGAAGKWKSDLAENNNMTRSERLSAAREKATHTDQQWADMKSFFGNTCLRCGAQDVELVKDHIVPLYQGGCDGLRNIQPLCRSCNSSKGADSRDLRLDYCQNNGLKMPAEYDKNACRVDCERLHDACQTPENACMMPSERLPNACQTPENACRTPENACRTPAPETRNQKPNTKKIEIYNARACEETPNPFSDMPSLDCLEFLQAYPEAQRDEAETWRVWQHLQKTNALVGLPRLYQALEEWGASQQWQQEGGRFIPLASNFLSKGYWKRKPPQETPQKTTYPPDFLAFWAAYPRKSGKDAALAEWRRREADLPDIGEILDAIQAARASAEWQQEGGRFIPKPATWLQCGGWADVEEQRMAIAEPEGW